MGPLRERSFALLFAARTISFFGTNLVPIALAFAVLDLTGSATDVGLVFAARTLAQISTLLVGGVVADRLPRRAVMIGSDAASLAVQLALGLLLVTGHARVWELVVLHAALGAAAAFYSPASTGLVPQTVPAALLQQANGFMSIARYSATIAGAAVGGVLVATIGSGWAILLDGGTFLASALLLASIRLPGGAGRAAAPDFLRELAEGWRAFTEHTWVWLLTAWISLFFMVTYAPFFVLGPYVAKASMGGAAAWATVLTGEAIGALVGGLVGLRARLRRPMVVIGSLMAVNAVQDVLLATQAPFQAIAAGAAASGFAFAFATVIWETVLQQRIPRDRLSRVSAYNWMGAMAFLPAGYALAGPVASVVGLNTTLWIGAGWIVVSTAAVLSVASVRAVRMDGAPEPLPAVTPA
jgi:predicted MFS family arabinose efflux permease